MHPAGSVIIFTVLSGLGFGLMAWLGVGLPAPRGWEAFGYFTLAYGMAVAGLVASTFHLGNPQRAWRAFSQWRSSWLSREGCLAVATLIVMAPYGFGAVFLGQLWMPLGYLGAGLSMLSVFATSMIYAQLKTVPRWRHWSTPVLFLMLSLGGGALFAGQFIAAIALLCVMALVQMLAWGQGDQRFARSGYTIASATGLGMRGTVRAFEPPHTGQNYLLKEMVYVIARKHALKLRLIAFCTAFVLPLLCLSVSQIWPVVGFAILCHISGVFTLRWLFFAQAEHVVGLYYGKR